MSRCSVPTPAGTSETLKTMKDGLIHSFCRVARTAV